MNDRSELRVRTRKHIHPDRRDEQIWEVLRRGEVVATIFGSREGIHIVSDLAVRNRIFLMEGPGMAPSFVVPLLAEGEICPWCGGRKTVNLDGEHAACPVCGWME